MAVRGLFKTLRNRNFLKLWVGQVVSNLGDEIAFFGLGVLVVFGWHGNSIDLSIIMIASSLPVLLLGPFAGVFVDKWNKKVTMMLADLIRAFLAILFIFCTTVFQLALVVFMISSVSRFFYPARLSIIPEILEKDILVEANSLSQLTYMLSIILGPVIATAMIYILGYTWIFIFDSASYLFSAFMITLMIYKPLRRIGAKKHAFQEFVEGLRYLWENSTVRVLILLFSVVMLFLGGLNVIFAIYIRDVLHMEVAGYGTMEVLFGVGMVLGSISTGVIAGKMKEGSMVLFGILGIGFLVLLLALFPFAILAFAVGIGLGFSAGFLNAPATALFQKSVEEDFRGRVFGAQGAVIQGFSLLSILIIGLLVAKFGILPIVLAAGISMLSLSIFFLLSKRVRDALEIEKIQRKYTYP